MATGQLLPLLLLRTAIWWRGDGVGGGDKQWARVWPELSG